MKLSPRQQAMLQHLKQHGYTTNDEFVARFDVTSQTVRRDLTQLADACLIERFHGGADVLSNSVNTAYGQRLSQNQAAKTRIAQKVAGMIPNGASVFINIGTTTELVAQQLMQHEGLQVVTNNIHVAANLSNKPDFSVIIAGGEVRHSDGGVIGEATSDFIKQFQMDFAIIGISGLSEDGALLDFDFREVKVSQAILDNAKTIILAVDSSKFGRRAMVKQGDLSQISVMVTDAQPPASLQDVIATHGVALHIV
jgi:DeoR family glycerol-3-phosphate regulon repressor